MAGFRHIPVLPAEALRFLAPHPGGVYLDGTVGGGGHAVLILDLTGPEGVLIGLDRDAEALETARRKLSPFGERVRLFQSNFSRLDDIVAKLGFTGIDGFLFDLGVSSHQLDSGARGFSFQQDAPLDMRMDTSGGDTATDLVNGLPEEELARIIREFGEERWAKRIATFIVRARVEAPIETTGRLVDIIKGAIPRGAWEERLHPATRTFQALRIVVNDELGSLERGMTAGLHLLNKGGRGVVISFHSLEDRMVKNSFRNLAQGCTCPKELPRCACQFTPQVKILTRKPVMAGDAEVRENPRARSAKLRAVEKL